MKEIYLNFNLPVQIESVRALFRVIKENCLNQVDVINLLISSPGGQVDAGISIYNFLKGLPIIVNTHNYGSCDSIAAIVFCAGEKRYTVTNSRFLIHGIGMNIEKMRFDERLLEEHLSSIKNQRETIAKIISKESRQKLEIIEKDMLTGIVLNANQAKEYGLVTDIKNDLVPKGSNLINIGF